MESDGVIDAGTPIASFEYADYVINLQMPVTGRIMLWNKTLFAESPINMLALSTSLHGLPALSLLFLMKEPGFHMPFITNRCSKCMAW